MTQSWVAESRGLWVEAETGLHKTTIMEHHSVIGVIFQGQSVKTSKVEWNVKGEL